MDHAAHFVEIAAVAKRETRVARFFSQVEALGDARFRVENHDFMPRTHYIASAAARQVHGVENNVPAKVRGAGMTLGSRNEQAQFIWRMTHLTFTDTLNPKAAQNPERGVVEDPDERERNAGEPLQWYGYPHRSGQ